MSTRRTVALSEVWAALDACLEGWRRKEKTHHWVIYPPDGGPPYRRIPLGSHGKRRDEDVESGHVKKMARFFGVSECVAKQIPGLATPKKKDEKEKPDAVAPAES